VQARLVLALVALSGGLCASAVHAQNVAPTVPTSPVPAGEVRDAQARFGALRASPSSDVVLERESATLRCERAPDAFLSCAIEARWTLRSPRDQRVSLYASAVGVTEVRLAADDLVSDAPSLQPLELPLVADEPREVVLSGRARLRAAEGMMDALTARHIVLGTPLSGPHATVLFTRAVERTFARAPAAVELHSETPPGFTVRALDRPTDAAGTVTLDAAALATRANVPFRIDEEGGFPVRHGGPVLGLGGTFDRGFRGRLGYELGLGELVIVSVSADSDFATDVVLGAVVEVATPSFGFPPSLSAGVGFAYRWAVLNALPTAPRTSGGLRLEVGAVLTVLGIVATFDYFPDDAAFTSSLLGRLSL
jgi:hypothetical protein